MSRRAATRRYTYGFGRMEDLAGLFVVAGAAGVGLGFPAADPIIGLVTAGAIIDPFLRPRHRPHR
jgi:divalent metal cation (Fe/Co/Zn/Cd) transporter